MTGHTQLDVTDNLVFISFYSSLLVWGGGGGHGVAWGDGGGHGVVGE